MKVIIDQQEELMIDSTIAALDDWWKDVTAKNYKDQRLIYRVHINNMEMFQGYEKYMIEHISSIENVHVETISIPESIRETETSMEEYLERFIDSSLELSQYFFGNLTESHWEKFKLFITGLDWIVKALEFEINLYEQLNETMPQYLNILDSIKQFVGEMEENLEQQDFVTVGDLIQYDLVPILQRIQSKE